MDIVYATSTTLVTTPDGGRHLVQGGTHWKASDPVVAANPNLFSADPRYGLSYSVAPPEMSEPPVEQVTGRVRWRESVAWMAETGGVTRFAEAGAGKVLSGMAKRIAPDAEAVPLNGPADLETFAKSL